MDTQTHTHAHTHGKLHVKMKAEIRVIYLQAPGERHEVDSPSWFSEATNPADTLISDFQPPEQ